MIRNWAQKQQWKGFQNEEECQITLQRTVTNRITKRVAQARVIRCISSFLVDPSNQQTTSCFNKTLCVWIRTQKLIETSEFRLWWTTNCYRNKWILPTGIHSYLVVLTFDFRTISRDEKERGEKHQYFSLITWQQRRQASFKVRWVHRPLPDIHTWISNQKEDLDSNSKR